MNPENKKLYFGMKPYMAVADTGRKTPTGTTIVQILYDDGTSVITTDQFFNLVKSEVPLDATSFRNLLLPEIMKRVFAVFTDLNVRQEDIDSIMAKMVSTWNETFNHAVNFKMGVSNMSDIDMVTINDLNNESESQKKLAIAAPVASTGGNTDSGSDSGPTGGVPVAA